MRSVLRLTGLGTETESSISVSENQEPKFSVSVRLRFLVFSVRFSVILPNNAVSRVRIYKPKTYSDGTSCSVVFFLMFTHLLCSWMDALLSYVPELFTATELNDT